MADDSFPQIRAIVTREAAMAAGLKTYYTGDPCIHGHCAPRSVVGGYCRQCNTEQRRNQSTEARQAVNVTRKRWRELNALKISAQKRESAARNKETIKAWWARNRHKQKEYNRVQYLKDATSRKQYAKQWRQDNQQKLSEMLSDWRLRNKDKTRVYSVRRKALKRAAGGSFTPDDIKRIHKQQRGRCAYCREKLGPDYHIDHIIPLIAGGSNWPRNLQLTCGVSGNKCNLVKRSKDPMIFAREMGRLL